MKTKKRQLKKWFTKLLIIVEIILFTLLVLLFSIDFPAATTPIEYQFKYFIIVVISTTVTYGCHLLIVNFGNKRLLYEFTKDNSDGKEIKW